VNPSSAPVSVPSGTQLFSATVINGSSQAVTWAVTGGDANGNIDTNGLYTAPTMITNSRNVTVTATSAQTTTSGTATVTLTGITVAVNPPSASVAPNGQQQFTATVSNASNQAVTWAVTGGTTNGTIDASGLFTAPATVPHPAAVTVTANSALATTPGSATVTIEAQTPAGTYPNIQVTATAAGGTVHTDVVTLTVD
jgi:hypothetical protein